MTIAEIQARRKTAQTEAGPISYLEVGDGPVALFVHGIGTNAILWQQVIEELADTRKCVALDLPLHGETPADSDADFSLTGLADMLDHFCSAAQFGPVDLVAHDTGGAIAQVFASRHPERLRSLCLTNCDTHDNLPPEAFKPTVELAASGAISASAPGLMANLEGTRELVFGSGYEDVKRLDLALVRSFLEPVLGNSGRAHEFERFLLSLKPDELLAVEPELAKLSVPTLIVWGNADIFFDVQWAYWLEELIAGANEVIEVEGGRLFFPQERPADLIEPLRRFWSAASSV